MDSRIYLKNLKFIKGLSIMNRKWSNKLIVSFTLLGFGLKLAAPASAVPITGFDQVNWDANADDGYGNSVSINDTNIGVTQVNSNTNTPPATNNSSMDIDINCSGSSPGNDCPVGAMSINDGSYISQSTTMTMSGIVSFDWNFSYANSNVVAGYILNPTILTGYSDPNFYDLSSFTPFISGQGNYTAPDYGAGSSGNSPVQFTVTTGDVLAFVVETIANNGTPPDSGQTFGTLHLYGFKVKDLPFEFNPIQGFALGLPLFLGLRMLKKHRSGHKQ